MNSVPDQAIENWLRSFKWALAAMPQSERDEIVAETRAHMEERLAQGALATDVLAGFGVPEDHARRFIDERELAGVMGSQRADAMLGAVLRRAHRNALAAAAMLLVVALMMVAFPVVVVAISKLFDPVHSGLWRGPHAFFIGINDTPADAHELLGFWIYPFAGVCLGLIWLAIRLVLVFAVKGLARTA